MLVKKKQIQHRHDSELFLCINPEGFGDLSLTLFQFQTAPASPPQIQHGQGFSSKAEEFLMRTDWCNTERI
jgi:hypothetical protein